MGIGVPCEPVLLHPSCRRLGHLARGCEKSDLDTKTDEKRAKTAEIAHESLYGYILMGWAESTAVAGQPSFQSLNKAVNDAINQVNHAPPEASNLVSKHQDSGWVQSSGSRLVALIYTPRVPRC